MPRNRQHYLFNERRQRGQRRPVLRCLGASALRHELTWLRIISERTVRSGAGYATGEAHRLARRGFHTTRWYRSGALPRRKQSAGTTGSGTSDQGPNRMILLEGANAHDDVEALVGEPAR